MRLIKSILLLLTLLDLVNSANLLSISPDSVDKEFSGQIDIHEVEIEVENEKEDDVPAYIEKKIKTA